MSGFIEMPLHIRPSTVLIDTPVLTSALKEESACAGKAAGENATLFTFLFHILFHGLQPPLFPLSPLCHYSRESNRNRLPLMLQQQLCHAANSCPRHQQVTPAV